MHLCESTPTIALECTAKRQPTKIIFKKIKKMSQKMFQKKFIKIRKKSYKKS